MRLLDAAPRHLLHHEIAVNFDVLGKQPGPDPPFSRNSEDANRGSSMEDAVYSIGNVGEGEFVRGLDSLSENGCLHLDSSKTYLAAWFPVCDIVGCCCSPVARFERVGDEGRTERPDHQVVIVQCSQHIGQWEAFRYAGGNADSRHYDYMGMLKRLVKDEVCTRVVCSCVAV